MSLLNAGVHLSLKSRLCLWTFKDPPPSQPRKRASDAADLDASRIDFEERNRLTSAEAGEQRYVVTSIVMLVQYSGNRADCSSGAAASDLLAASAFGVTIRSIVAMRASLAS